MEKATKWELAYTRSLDHMEDSFLLKHERATPDDRVRAMQLACLEGAVKTILNGGYKEEPQLFEQDVLWITGQTPSLPNFSFREICDAVGYDAATVRDELLRKVDEVRAGIIARRSLRNVTRPRACQDKVRIR